MVLQFILSQCMQSVNRDFQSNVKGFTFNWVEKVKKGVGGHLFSDRPHDTPALVLLFLLNRFDGNIFPLVPFNHTSVIR